MTSENKKQYAYTVIAEDDKIFRCSIDELADAVISKFNYTLDADNNAFALDIDLLIYELISVEDNPNGPLPISNWKIVKSINLRKYATYIWETKNERKEYPATEIVKLLDDIVEKHHEKWLSDEKNGGSQEKVDKAYEAAISIEHDYRDIFPVDEIVADIDLESIYKIMEKYPLCTDDVEKETQIETIPLPIGEYEKLNNE